MIAAFAALALTCSPFQPALGVGGVIRFDNIETAFGVSPASNQMFTCPSTAFYFVHYRLLVRTTSGIAECGVRLAVEGGGADLFLEVCLSLSSN